jgi:ribonuclease HI
LGLKLAKRLAPEVLVCLLDSKLVVSQVNGLYRVKQDHLAKLLLEVRQAEKAYEKVLYKLIPREKNRGADALANEVLDGARQL